MWRITRHIITSSNLGHLEGETPDPEQLIDVWSASAPSSAEIPRPSTVHPEKEWVVLVINDKKFVNAFAAPGLVCVSTGIMPVARNEEGLAAIIGHGAALFFSLAQTATKATCSEIGHVTMRHTAEHLSLGKVFLPITGLLLMLGIDPFLSSMLTTYLLSLPHSRALETEGECSFCIHHISCSPQRTSLASSSCPGRAMTPARHRGANSFVYLHIHTRLPARRVFEDLKKLEKVSVPKFLNTHPPTPERIAVSSHPHITQHRTLTAKVQHLKTLLPESYDIYHANPECARLEEMRARGILGRVRMNIDYN